VLFFKENGVHVVSGAVPEKFETSFRCIPGVPVGSHRSLAIADDTLYYLSREGVFSWNGSTARRVFGVPADKFFVSGAAGANGTKYYISLRDSGGGCEMFVYDTSQGKLLKEDDTWAYSFGRYNGQLCFLDKDKQRVIALGGGANDKVLSGDDAISADLLRVKWSATLALPLEINHLRVTASVREGSYLELWLSRFGEPYEQLGSSHNRTNGSNARRVLEAAVPRSDGALLELRGAGAATVERIEVK
jgi:hypothetical protein